jgi:hypothetical protein
MDFFTAQRKLEEETARARAEEEAALRKQKDVHSKNQELAEKEYRAAKAAEVQAEQSVKESKVGLQFPAGKRQTTYKNFNFIGGNQSFV